MTAEDLEVLKRLPELDVVARTREPLRNSGRQPRVRPPDAEVGRERRDRYVCVGGLTAPREHVAGRERRHYADPREESRGRGANDDRPTAHDGLHSSLRPTYSFSARARSSPAASRKAQPGNAATTLWCCATAAFSRRTRSSTIESFPARLVKRARLSGGGNTGSTRSSRPLVRYWPISSASSGRSEVESWRSLTSRTEPARFRSAT